jgi:hypothetical protein
MIIAPYTCVLELGIPDSNLDRASISLINVSSVSGRKFQYKNLKYGHTIPNPSLNHHFRFNTSPYPILHNVLKSAVKLIRNNLNDKFNKFSVT